MTSFLNVQYTKAIKINPSDDYAYKNRGNSYSELNQYDKAIQDFNKAIKIKSDDDDVYHSRGFAYYKLKKYKQAIKDFDKTLALNPESWWVYFNLADTYFDSGNYDSAIQCYNKLLELDGLKHDKIYYKRGKCYEALGEKEKAQADFTKAKELGYKD